MIAQEHVVSVKSEYLIKIVKDVSKDSNIVASRTSNTVKSEEIMLSENSTDKGISQEKEDKRSQRMNTYNDKSNDRSNDKNKKRPRDGRPATGDRLCGFIIKGSYCPYGGSCQYNHNAMDFLSRKPIDIGSECYQYSIYGWCANGVMCRFGSKHIDGTTGKSLIRNIEDGGVKDKLVINALTKSLQILLRKKSYDYKRIEKDVHSKATQIIKPNSLNPDDLGETITEIKTGSDKNEDGSTIQEKKMKLVDENISIESTNVSTVLDFPVLDHHNSSNSISNSAQDDKEPTNTGMEPLVEIKKVASSSSSSTEPYDDYVKLVDFSNKVYVAPLTTVGNLPFRRILKEFGADITCGEMAMTENLQSGQASEWALLRRHSSEDVFGIQIAGSHNDQFQRVSALLRNEISSDFIDINCGCPIDIVCNRGCGAALLNKHNRLLGIISTVAKTSNRSVTVKVRTGWDEKHPNTHKLVPEIQKIANGRVAAIMVHGRSRLQRYSKLANWDYILEVAKSQSTDFKRIPVIGNGDILSWEDWQSHQDMIRSQTDDMDEIGLCSCAMIARGAIIKPWLPTEIKEKRHIDISASERMEILQKFSNYGMEHWGSDQQGINTTRRFLLEWLSFLYKYVPVGLTERSQKINQRPPLYFGRSDTETLLASANSNDWVKISELFLGPVPDGFAFQPKHKSNSYSPESVESVSNG